MKYILKYIGIIILILFQSQTIYSNSVKCIIKGKVIDIKTKEPLPGVNIIVEHTTIGTATDRSGDYSITVSPGQIHLLASKYFFNNLILSGALSKFPIIICLFEKL